MDLDDFADLGLGNAPVRPPPRPSRFLPKSAKLIPKQEPKPTLPTPSKNPDEVVDVKPSVDQDVAMEEKEQQEPKPDSVPMDEDEENQEDEEDQVIRAIDVFLAPGVHPDAELYVMQYPLRPSWRPYELAEKCKEVRVKPKEGKLEVDLLVDTESNYDHNAPDQLKNDKQTLCSRRAPLETSYGVGVLLGNMLHLNQVDAVLQLRPSMEHLMTRGLKRSTDAGESKDEINGLKDASLSKKPAKAKTVKAAVGTSEAEAADVEESWISLEYHGTNSFESSAYQRKMTSRESAEIPFSMSPSDYMNSLCPVSATAQNQQRSSSIRSLLLMPLETRLKKWLFEGPQLKRFIAAKHLAPNDSNEEVLEILQQHAWLVQGLWVPKSSPLNAAKPLPRDFVIGLFQKNRVVSCSDFTNLDAYQLIQKDVELHLSMLAIYKPSGAKWELKEPKDVLFIDSYPDIVKNQEAKWADQEKKIMEALKGLRKRPNSSAEKNPVRTGPKSKPR